MTKTKLMRVSDEFSLATENLTKIYKKRSFFGKVSNVNTTKIIGRIINENIDMFSKLPVYKSSHGLRIIRKKKTKQLNDDLIGFDWFGFKI